MARAEAPTGATPVRWGDGLAGDGVDRQWPTASQPPARRTAPASSPSSARLAGYYCCGRGAKRAWIIRATEKRAAQRQTAGLTYINARQALFMRGL